MIESAAASVTYLFSDIEGSTRLWEADPGRAAQTVAWHDEISRAAVQRHRGAVVKTTGDGVHAVFDDPADAIAAVIDLQLALAKPSTERAPLNVRCGLHLGADQQRDNDFYGPAVNRAARIMSAAHGGQVLLSQAVADRVTGRLPQGVVLRDLGAVRLRDLGSPEHVFQLIHPALRREFPPLRSMATTPNNLAQQLNSFVGRDRDMAQVQQLLASSRLLTLLGMGGLGKSRLSVQVAAVVLDNYADGVWFVEVAALSDPQLVTQAAASVLGVKEEPGGTVTEALTQFVRDKQLLIVLDNCEHVVQACAELARRLLEAGPKVKVLASSRDSLRIAGEIVFPVAPLPAPERDDVRSVHAMMAIDSVRLFIDRAKAVQPAFRLSEDLVRAVAEICRRLDGIPLAIELAAARVRALSVEQIAARLDDRFRLLNRGDRTALPRQQTLRALIDWSHDLLDAKERALFRRLAVFAGGWSMEAAEVVGSGGLISREDVVDLLSSLVEKSLAVMVAESGRYRMLDTVRQYAYEKLAESEEEDKVIDAHLRFFLALGVAGRAGIDGPDQGAWMGRLDTDRENLWLAFSHSGGRAQGAQLALSLLDTLRRYCIKCGRLSAAAQLAAQLLQREEFQGRDPDRCRALFGAGQLDYFMGNHESAIKHLEESLAIARELKDERAIARILQPLGMSLLGIGSADVAASCLEEAVQLAADQGADREQAAAVNALAQLRRSAGCLSEAEELLLRVVQLTRKIGDAESTAIAMLNLAMVRIALGSALDAREILGDVLHIAAEAASRGAQQSALEVCAGLSAEVGDWRAAAIFFGAAEEEASRTGLRRDPADELFLRPLELKAQSALGDSAFEAAMAAGRSLTFEAALEHAAIWLRKA
jgi:predicted ATPase/class 3 adenylate cyclase